jgi:hypothetical protein
MAQLPRLDSATAEFLQRADSLAVSAGGLFALPDLSSGPPSFDGLQPFGNGSGLVRQLSFDPLRSALSSGGNGDFMPPPPKRPHLSSEADAAAMHSVLGPLPAPVAAGHRGEHTRVRYRAHNALAPPCSAPPPGQCPHACQTLTR